MTRIATHREYGSVKDAALLADVDTSTVWKWIKAKKLRTYRTPSGRTRVRLSDVVKPNGRDA